jgi:hypothetical protein
MGSAPTKYFKYLKYLRNSIISKVTQFPMPAACCNTATRKFFCEQTTILGFAPTNQCTMELRPQNRHTEWIARANRGVGDAHLSILDHDSFVGTGGVDVGSSGRHVDASEGATTTTLQLDRILSRR